MARDFFDPLVDELLSEVAENFFEARRLIDRKVDLFYTYVKQLAPKAQTVSQRAAFLNHLLLNEAARKSFYRMVTVDPTLYIAAKSFEPDTIPTPKRSGLGVRSKFTKMVLDAYKRLQVASDDYLFGTQRSAVKKASGGSDVYYGLIVSMLEILNQDIDKINCSMSPGCTLQFAKGFHPDTLQKERIVGTGFQNYAALDRKLLYTPIDLDALNIPKYPPLANLRGVVHKIERLCKLLYAENTDAVKNLTKNPQFRKQTSKT